MLNFSAPSGLLREMEPSERETYLRRLQTPPMSKNTSILLIVWNALLTGLVIYLMTGRSSKASTTAAVDGSDSSGVEVVSSDDMPATGLPANARIAYFELDSLEKHLELIKDQRAHYESEVSRKQNALMEPQRDAQAEADALMSKDQTYSTKAEQEKDMMRLQELDYELKQLGAQTAEEVERLEMRIMEEMTTSLKDYLEEYNKTAGFDYVIMMQPGGQVWPGNASLNISDVMVKGMNDAYAKKKAEKAGAKK